MRTAQTGSPAINACGYPLGHGAFTRVSVSSGNTHDSGNGTSVATFVPLTRALSRYSGQTVQLRWMLSSDPGADFAGAFVDRITLGGTALDRAFANGFEVGPDFTCH